MGSSDQGVGALHPLPRSSGSHLSSARGKVNPDLFFPLAAESNTPTPSVLAPPKPLLALALGPLGDRVLAAPGVGEGWPQRAVQQRQEHPQATDPSPPGGKRASGLPKDKGEKRKGPGARLEAPRGSEESGEERSALQRRSWEPGEVCLCLGGRRFYRRRGPAPRASPRPRPPGPLAAGTHPSPLPPPGRSSRSLGRAWPCWGSARGAPARAAACCASPRGGEAGSGPPGPGSRSAALSLSQSGRPGPGCVQRACVHWGSIWARVRVLGRARACACGLPCVSV